MNSGARSDLPMTIGSTPSHRLYYRLRRQRYKEMAVQPGAEDASGQQAMARNLAEREEQIAKLEADVASLRDLALRARAELDNARKRFKREKAETIKFANENLVRELIGAVDNLERAMESSEAATDIKPLRDGVRMVFGQISSILQQKGLEVIVPDGQAFNPHFHEAVSAEARDDVPDNQIIGTLQKGYLLGGRVVRPAMVRVARAVKAPPIEEVPTPAEEEAPEAADEMEEREKPLATFDADFEETPADFDDTAAAESADAREQAPAERAVVLGDESQIETPDETSSPPGAEDIRGQPPREV